MKEQPKENHQILKNRQIYSGRAHIFLEDREEIYEQIDHLFRKLEDEWDWVAETLKLENLHHYNKWNNEQLLSYFEGKLRNNKQLRKRIYRKKIIESFIFGFLSCLIVSGNLGNLPLIGRAIFIIVGGFAFFGAYYISGATDPD